MAEKTLQQQFADLQDQVTALSGQQATLIEENASLRKEVAELTKAANQTAEAPKHAPKPEIPTESFKVGKKTYVFTSAKFTLPANKKTGRKDTVTVTAVDALTDEKILQELVALESGVIKEVEG